MRKILRIVICIIGIMLLASCTSNNANKDKFVGEWYCPGNLEEGALVLSEDGLLSNASGSKMGTFSVGVDSVTLTIDGKTMTGELEDVDGYSCLEIEGSLWVKGYDNAVLYQESYCQPDPSDIWAYDFSGEYYQAYDERLEDLSEYEQMVEIKIGGSYTVNQQNGGFTLTNNYSGYRYGRMDHAVTVDIDRENKTMKHIDSMGYIDREYMIEWCEETQEFYFIEESSLGEEYDTYWFRLENVQ